MTLTEQGVVKYTAVSGSAQRLLLRIVASKCQSKKLDNSGVCCQPGAWTCPLCVAEAHAEGAGRRGGLMALEEFERSAVAFKRSWWGSEGRARKVRPHENALTQLLRTGVIRAQRCKGPPNVLPQTDCQCMH